MSRRRHSRMLGVLTVLAVSLCTAHFVGAIEPEFLIDSDPDLQVPEAVQNFSPALKTLWLTALDRPETDMQRMAAETIARGHQQGVPELIEAIPQLERILIAEASHPAARFAAARALIVLESRGSAEKLFQASQGFGSELRQLVEPALARWDFGLVKEVWIKRLSHPETRLRDLLLAMRGLGQVREPSVLPRLLSIAKDPLRDAVVRLEAATATGQIAETGLEPDADRLAQAARTPPFINQLCAVRLLARHDSDTALQLLIGLANDAEPAIAAAALHRLNDIDSNLVLSLAEAAMKNADQRVRLEGAHAYLVRPTAERIGPLTRLLADAHPGVRRRVCEGLAHLARNAELNDPIRHAAMQVLGEDRWQGQEQAALLLGVLEHKPAAGRLVALLESPRTEVMITAAWALRKAAAEETIPALIDKASRQTEQRKRAGQQGLDDQVAHLFEALGVLAATDAMPLLLEYIPKNPIMGVRSRSAAIWALGRLREGTRDAPLEEALSDRIADFPDLKPESDLVKQMCAVALVRMRATDQAPMMRTIVKTIPISLPLDVTLRWAVKELSGEELPPPAPLTLGQGNWFLEPIP